MPRERASQSRSPLSSTVLAIHIVDLVAEYTVRHLFRNEGLESIEAVFSFPVPLDAAFVGMRATLAGETLEATIQPKRQASRTYDGAIADGHSAVLLSCPEPGVLCTSLGNLKPGEAGEIEIRFVCALDVADRMARFSLPLVHRPRYGTWKLEALETPVHDFVVEHPMEASIRVEGLLASAPVNCLTHSARFERWGDALELTFGHAMLDRDLVVTFELADKLPAVARLIEDGDASLGMASFVLPDVARQADREMDLCLVLDGSGSMSGDAIEQCRVATTSVIEALGKNDRIQVLRFGSTVVPLLARPLPCTDRVREALLDLVPTIASDLGGTEMGLALRQALAQFGPADEARSRAVILVTDGAVQPRDIAQAKSAAIKGGVRIFVVAVGSSAGTEVLRPLAEKTGATLERAVPAEPIADGAMRQLRRAREAGPVEIKLRWPGGRTGRLPLGNHYPGDAVTVAAVLDASAGGMVHVSAPSLGMKLRLPLASRKSDSSIRAFLGQQRYLSAPGNAREGIALRYGLLTRETSAVLVRIRADGEKTDGLPQIVQVPQMVPQVMVSGRVAAKSHCKPVLSALKHATSPVLYDIAVERTQHELMSVESFDMATPAAPDRTDPTFALTVFREIYVRLREVATNFPGRFPTAREVIDALESKYQSAAKELLAECGIQLDDERQCARLGLALGSVLGTQKASKEEESFLAIARTRSGQAGVKDSTGVGSSVSALEDSIRKLLPAALKTKARLGFFASMIKAIRGRA